MSESFNSWVGEARNKPAVDLIDTVRGMLMEQRATRYMTASTWSGELAPHAEEYVRQITNRRDHFLVRPSNYYRCEVEGTDERQEVDVQARECSCRRWQMTGLPCIHAVVVIASKQAPLWHTFVDEAYHTYRYLMAYEGAISTMPGKEQWILLDTDIKVGVPITARPRGRPRKKRIQSCLETNTARSTNQHKCGRCGMWGHHRNTCKNPLDEHRETNS